MMVVLFTDVEGVELIDMKDENGFRFSAQEYMIACEPIEIYCPEDGIPMMHIERGKQGYLCGHCGFIVWRELTE